MMQCQRSLFPKFIPFWLFFVWTTFVVAQNSNNNTCQQFLTDFASCLIDTFDLQSDAIACDTCRLEYSAYINNSTDFLSCTDIESIQCAAVKECPCNECDSVLEMYLNCEVINYYNNNQCPSGISCRTSIVNCENSFDEYRNCIYRLPITNNETTATTTGANGKTCDECRLNVANQFINGGTCDAAQTNFCTGVQDTCVTACGDCVDELDFFFTCDVLNKSNGNCQIDCNTTSTPPISEEPLCSNDLSEFALCVTQDLATDTDGVACDNCRNNAEASLLGTSVATLDTCTNIQQEVCTELIPTCADICGSCNVSLARYWICLLATTSFIDCSTTKCNVSSPTTASPQSTTTTNPISIDTPTTIHLPSLSPLSTPIDRTVMPSIAGPPQSPIRTPIVPSTVSEIPPTTSSGISKFHEMKCTLPLIATTMYTYFVIML